MKLFIPLLLIWFSFGCKKPEKIAQQLQVKGHDFFATGVSIVMHPFSPLVPIIHMNVRYFEVSSGEQWFGGGIDLTPIYVEPAQAQYFHQQIKHTCDLHDHTYYETFKKWADDYFFIKHRNETRGVGGVFFDRLGATADISLYQRFEFVKDIGNIFAPIYTKFMEENKDISYGKGEKQFQAIRRGRSSTASCLEGRKSANTDSTNGRYAN